MIKKTKNKGKGNFIREFSPRLKNVKKSIKGKNVLTWKGALLSMFFASVAFAFIWAIRDGKLESIFAAPASTLYFTPSTSTVINGSSFSLNAMINPGTNKVTAAALRITYDPAKLALDSITPSSAFSLVLSSASINNTNGTASIDLGVPTTNPSVTSISSIATFNFHAIATATNSSVSFTSGSQAAAENETSNVVLATAGTTVTINSNNVDTMPPTGGSISYLNGSIFSAPVNIIVNDGTDTSGINILSRIVKRRSAALINGVCGTFGSYLTISATGAYPNFSDSTVSNGNCYQYQYQVSDNANPANQATYTNPNIVRFELAAKKGKGVGSGKPRK